MSPTTRPNSPPSRERILEVARVEERLERSVGDNATHVPVSAPTVTVMGADSLDVHHAFASARRTICGLVIDLHFDRPHQVDCPTCSATFAELDREGFVGGRPVCRGVTRSYRPCKRDPLPGRDFCPSHQHLLTDQ